MKFLTALLAMALSGGIMAAQTPSMTPESQQPQSDTAPPPDQTTVKPQTVRGCLSSAGDNYTVTDQVSGKTFKLAGATDRLKQFIGQTVEISGSVKSLEGESTPASASTGDILTLADVKQVSDKCSSVPQSGALTNPQLVMLALLQQPVNADANTQLDSSAQMSSNADDTSTAAASTRSVSTNTTEHSAEDVAGHTGAHGLSVPTANTSSVGHTTPPTSSAAGFATAQNPNDKGVAPMNPQAYKPANQKSEATKKQVPSYLNAETIGSNGDDGDKAAVAASSAEMQTDASGQKTTYRTERKSEANGSGNANPKETQPPSDDVKTETTPTPPQ